MLNPKSLNGFPPAICGVTFSPALLICVVFWRTYPGRMVGRATGSSRTWRGMRDPVRDLPRAKMPENLQNVAPQLDALRAGCSSARSAARFGTTRSSASLGERDIVMSSRMQTWYPHRCSRGPNTRVRAATQHRVLCCQRISRSARSEMLSHAQRK